MTTALLALAIIVGGMYYAGSDEAEDNSHVHVCIGKCAPDVRPGPCDKEHDYE